MQRVWNFPMGTKQGCPQDRESSGHVGIHIKKMHTSLCANRHFCLGVCVHICISVSTNSHFAVYYRIWESGRVGKTREKEITASTLVLCSPCFSHQHWPELTVDSAATCDDGEGRNGNCPSAYLILPFVKFLGQQKCLNGSNPLHLSKASALVNPDIFPAAQLR